MVYAWQRTRRILQPTEVNVFKTLFSLPQQILETRVHTSLENVCHLPFSNHNKYSSYQESVSEHTFIVPPPPMGPLDVKKQINKAIANRRHWQHTKNSNIQTWRSMIFQAFGAADAGLRPFKSTPQLNIAGLCVADTPCYPPGQQAPAPHIDAGYWHWTADFLTTRRRGLDMMSAA